MTIVPRSRLGLSVVVPCFNEAQVFHALCERLVGACEVLDWDYELVFIDDGSTDHTWQKICEASKHNRHICGLRLSRNHGHQLALSAGLARARGDRILIIDADLQDPPELLPQMMQMMDEGADVIYGQRRHRVGESAFKLLTAHLFYRAINMLSDTNIPRDTGDFRLITREVLLVLNAMPEGERFIRGMVSWIGFSQQPLLYDRHERAAGRSKYPFRKMVRFAATAVTSFSTKPLRVASYFGVALGVLCFVAIIYLAIAHFQGHTVQGWTSLIVIILFVGAVQLFVLGIIGEYLGRLFIESKRRPLYIIAEIVGRKSDHAI